MEVLKWTLFIPNTVELPLNVGIRFQNQREGQKLLEVKTTLAISRVTCLVLGGGGLYGAGGVQPP